MAATPTTYSAVDLVKCKSETTRLKNRVSVYFVFTSSLTLQPLTHLKNMELNEGLMRRSATSTSTVNYVQRTWTRLVAPKRQRRRGEVSMWQKPVSIRGSIFWKSLSPATGPQ
ncbi:hypothetical protein JOB18_020599 [Solea senegalensis]|uniref:Uncharacterized protein n=1 Tax=Solea senegalensis TaxID=28829 RepID=A0AAV6QWF8_SOLSE|nr:hypothetical protein JOB18_020599 [Solea senegalensis]